MCVHIYARISFTARQNSVVKDADCANICAIQPHVSRQHQWLYVILKILRLAIPDHTSLLCCSAAGLHRARDCQRGGCAGFVYILAVLGTVTVTTNVRRLEDGF